MLSFNMCEGPKKIWYHFGLFLSLFLAFHLKFLQLCKKPQSYISRIHQLLFPLVNNGQNWCQKLWRIFSPLLILQGECVPENLSTSSVHGVFISGFDSTTEASDCNLWGFWDCSFARSFSSLVALPRLPLIFILPEMKAVVVLSCPENSLLKFSELMLRVASTSTGAWPGPHDPE